MCEKYWPDHQKQQSYGNLTVNNKTEVILNDALCSRVLEVNRSGSNVAVSILYYRYFVNFVLSEKINFSIATAYSYVWCIFQPIQEMVTVTQFHFHGWPPDGLPSNPGLLLDLMNRVLKNQISTGNKPIVVMCRHVLVIIANVAKHLAPLLLNPWLWVLIRIRWRVCTCYLQEGARDHCITYTLSFYHFISLIGCSDGSGRSGAFVVLYSQLERLKTEHVVDVFQGIKAARTQRMRIVHNVVCIQPHKHTQYLHDCWFPFHCIISP